MSLNSFPASGKRKKLFYYTGAFAVLVLVTVGIFASNGWFPSTDALTGRRVGWFGKPLTKNAPNSWNPIALNTSPTPLPLSKEYIYAGSRLLAVEDANANQAPPADLAVWRPTNGYFYVLGGSGSQQTFYQWGGGANQYDWPVPGDYDGDSKTDFSIFRPTDGTWWITNSSSGSFTSIQLGASCSSASCDISAPSTYNGDLPAPADYDGDGKTDIAVFRPSTGIWYVINSSTGQSGQFTFGTSGDTPASADFDGDGRADYTVWRSSDHTFYIIKSSNGTNLTIPVTDGASGDKPVPADYDGDGKADIALYRDGTTPTWHIYPSSGASAYQVSYGASGDKLVENDYDGDGKCDIAVWRPSTGVWWILKSSNGQTRNETWGMSGDIPVPAYYRR